MILTLIVNVNFVNKWKEEEHAECNVLANPLELEDVWRLFFKSFSSIDLRAHIVFIFEILKVLILNMQLLENGTILWDIEIKID